VDTNRNARLNRANGGFTLIEVVIALVILAIGLLGLEALGIASSKMAARAAVQSEYTSRAGTTLEGLMARLQLDDPTLTGTSYCPGTTAVNSASGREVARLYQCAWKNGNTWTVRVAVRPLSGHPVLATRDSIYLTANVFDPD
jgi:prepilin-type N-terminal cleavage/methylation domain-containing protein